MAISNRCFLCGRKMVAVEGLLYELCSNKKCPRSKPLNPPKEQNPDDTSTDKEE